MSLSWKDHGTNGTHRLSTEEEGFCPSSSKEGLKLCVAITYGMPLTESTKSYSIYKVQNIWQFILVITSYFSMIKFSLKKKKNALISEDKCKDQVRNIYTCDKSSGSRFS